MASILAQQLQALGTKGHQFPRTKGTPSLLFANQQAADIDLQTIHDVASEGEEDVLADKHEERNLSYPGYVLLK